MAAKRLASGRKKKSESCYPDMSLYEMMDRCSRHMIHFQDVSDHPRAKRLPAKVRNQIIKAQDSLHDAYQMIAKEFFKGVT